MNFLNFKNITGNRFYRCLLFVICFHTYASMAQAPSGYYDTAQGLSGGTLKSALHDIIKGHTTYPYSSSGTDVWDILKQADKDPNNASNVIGLYSGFSMDAAAEYAGGAGWNREHVWAKSRGDFGTSQGAGTDVHHLRATDISTNSARNNRNFDVAPNQYVDGSGNYSGPTDSNTSSTDWVWEPRDAVKGDVARMVLYMATRYEGDAGEPDLELTETYLSNTDKSPLHSRLSTLLAWHQADPVDAAEQNRNDIIYGYQNNRNPYIDHPEYVCLIYSCNGGGGNATPQFTTTGGTSATENQAYNYSIVTSDADTGDALSITAPTLPSWLTLVDNGNRTATLSGTPGPANVGSNPVVLSVTDGSVSSTQSFTISVAPIGGGSGSATDLIISEYIEGSSNNKGLEIANFTGGSVSLSDYSLQKATNGSGSWGSALNLSGTLADGAVYVVVNSSSDATMQGVADLVTGGGIVTFNGNDAVGLFKSGTLIDLLGNPSSASNYAQNVTLVRKSTINSPNSTYTISEWESFATDTFSNLGGHVMDGGSPGPCDNTSGLTSSNVTHNSAAISWSSVNGVVNYNVRYRVNGTSTWIETSASSNAMNLTGLNASATYEFQVQTVCSTNTGAYSASATFTTLVAPCTATSGLGSASVTENSATLTWSQVSEAISYNVRYRATGSSNWTTGTSSSINLAVSGLSSSTQYEFQIQTVCASNSAAYSGSVNFTTFSPNPTSELYFSEYIEGSSLNKALEVANTSGSSVDMSGYDVRKQTNGAGTWSGGISLSGSLSNGAVYVLANSSANADILGKADFTGGNNELTFNGNDAIGLFKDGVLMDIIGTFNSSANFAQNVTLRRNDGINAANTQYTTSEWTSFTTDNSAGLGQRYGETTPNTPPSVSLTSPSNGSTFTDGDIVAISASASDTDGTVTSVEFFADGTSVGTDSSNPFSTNWTIGEGTFSLTAIATDNEGATTTSSAINVTGQAASSEVVISYDDFESGWGSFQDGGSDAYRYTGNNYAYAGSAALGIQDNTNSSVVTYTNAVDITGYDELRVDFYFYPRSMDNSNEDFWLQVFDGSGYVTVATWARNIDFQNNTFYSASVTIDPTIANFASNMKVRFRCDASGNADDVYIDEVTVTGIVGSTTNRNINKEVQTTNLVEETIPSTLESSFNLSVYPNPASTNLNISIEMEEEETVEITVFDIRGAILSTQKEEVNQGQNEFEMDIRAIKNGLYYLEILTTKDKIVRRFVKE